MSATDPAAAPSVRSEATTIGTSNGPSPPRNDGLIWTVTDW